LSANQLIVSIITICLNDKEGLEKTIISVRNQSFRDFEHIIIDGGSKDGTVEVLEKFKNNLSYYKSEKDNGRYNAMNKGILKASGLYCLFLNSGDYLASENTLSEVFRNKEDYGILYGDLLVNHSKKTIISYQPSNIDLKYLMAATISHPASFIKKELFDKYGLYDESFIIAGDYELFLRLVIKFQVSTKHLPIVISVFNTDGISSAEKYMQLQIEERTKAQKSYLPNLVIEFLQKQDSEDANFHNQMFKKTKEIPFLWILNRIIFKITWLFFVKK